MWFILINRVWKLYLKQKHQFSLFCDSLPVREKSYFWDRKLPGGVFWSNLPKKTTWYLLRRDLDARTTSRQTDRQTVLFYSIRWSSSDPTGWISSGCSLEPTFKLTSNDIGVCVIILMITNSRPSNGAPYISLTSQTTTTCYRSVQAPPEFFWVTSPLHRYNQSTTSCGASHVAVAGIPSSRNLPSSTMTRGHKQSAWLAAA